MKTKLFSTLVILFTLFTFTSCEFSFNIGDSDTKKGDTKGTDILYQKINEFNKCLENDDVEPCKAMVAKDSGYISGTDAVREVLSKFPPYMKSMQSIEFAEQKSTKAENGEAVYVVLGKAKFKSADDIIEMYVKYNLVEQDGELKFYGIQFDPNKINSDF